MTNEELIELGISYIKAEYQLEKTFGLETEVDELFRHAYEFVKKHIVRKDESAQECLTRMYLKSKGR